jgi:hypothetical protein
MSFAKTGKAGDFAKRVSGEAPPFALLFTPFFGFVLLRRAIVAGGAKRRHLYQDYGTPNNQTAYF